MFVWICAITHFALSLFKLVDNISTIHFVFVCVGVCVCLFVLAIPVCLDPCDLVDCGDSVTSGYSEPVWGNDLVSPPDLTDLSEVSPHSYLSFSSCIPVFPDVPHDNMITGCSRESRNTNFLVNFIKMYILILKNNSLM